MEGTCLKIFRLQAVLTSLVLISFSMMKKVMNIESISVINILHLSSKLLVHITVAEVGKILLLFQVLMWKSKLTYVDQLYIYYIHFID